MSQSFRTEEEIFDAARTINDAAARHSYLERACDGDADLRVRIEELFATADAAESFFADGSSAVRTLGGELHAATRTVSPATKDHYVGTRIGNYKLLEHIGEGGCGVVYMAEQEKPVRRRVALKIIKLGMDTRSVIARFEAERQALAMMDHPNIARVLDAGATESGRPYFVMELVRGFKFTEYCDTNRLTTGRRLELFSSVCQAIQHAHQKGIIHRDIKPSNILVTLHDGVPVPKVIDFGIVKATEAQLTDKTLFTAYAQIIGTPAYMSPEQAEMSGLDIDTRADIYSLGVLLYELLTGRTPFDPKRLLESGFDEMRRTLRERDPQKPSTILTSLRNEELTTTARYRHSEPPRLISQLRGDLDWIVMKALEKDRKRRYETANALAMDIQRHLNHEPVLARPPSRGYRLQKLVRRNKTLCASAAAITLVLVCGLAVSTWMYWRERQARHRAVAAEREQGRLREIAERGLQTEAELRRQAEAREKITQAASLIGLGRLDEADRVIADIPSAQGTLEGATVFRKLGEWNALRGRWHEAAARYSSLVRVGVLEGWETATLDYTGCAAALMEHGDAAEYRRFCEMTVAQFRGTTDLVVAERALKICLLLPPDDALMGELTPFYELAAKSLERQKATRGPEDWMVSWRCISVGLMEYRCGRMTAAEAAAKRCLDYGASNPARTATAKTILALAHHRMGEVRMAESQLSQVREALDAKFSKTLTPGNGNDGYWYDWALARVLFREAVELIESDSVR
jgi:serine/threonine protein kinase